LQAYPAGQILEIPDEAGQYEPNAQIVARPSSHEKPSGQAEFAELLPPEQYACVEHGPDGADSDWLAQNIPSGHMFGAEAPLGQNEPTGHFEEVPELEPGAQK
jgi:hypothetical protein